jgi:cobalt-zinc-cadmium efflux system membrane fusion protein
MRTRTIVVLAAFEIWGCRRESSEEPSRPRGAEPHHHPEEEQHADIPKVVKLSAEVLRDAGISTQPAEKRRLAATIELNGQVAADPDHIAEIGARAPGRVVKVLVKEGDHVNAGQTVVVVSSPELARRRAEYTGAGAKAVAARRNATRLRSLAAQRLGADQDAVAAEADAAALEAERDAAAQIIRSMGASLTASGDASLMVLSSPIAGQVVQRDAVPGQMVEPNRTLATIADLSRIWFQAQLFEKDLAQINEGATAEVRLNGYPDNVFRAKVARIASRVDPQARTLTARLSVEDRDQRLRLGLFGKARISITEREAQEHIAVPLSAITEIGERKVVFVRHRDGDFEWHAVTLGPSAGSYAPVLSGLDAGEQIVVSGVHTLKSVVLRATLKDDQ